MSNYHFVYPSLKESETRLLEDLKRICELEEIPAELEPKLLLVISEAFNNAVLHGNGLDGQKMVEVLLRVNDSSVIADIIDQGHGGLDKIAKRRPSTLLSENGRGIDLIKRCSSSAEFLETAGGGLRVTIILNLTDEKKLLT